jgi:hypothetical protein
MMALVLFAQGVVSASVYAAPAPALHERHSAACHEKQAPASSICLAHCSQADQIGLDHGAALAAPVSTASWQVSLPPVQRIALRIPRQQVALDTGPPIPIRFCSFLI